MDAAASGTKRRCAVGAFVRWPGVASTSSAASTYQPKKPRKKKQVEEER
jgi:hypothetical protein